MNSNILKDKEFIEEMKQILHVHRGTKHLYNCMEAWDHLKHVVRCTAKEIGSKKGKQNTKETEELDKLKRDLLEINSILEGDSNNKTNRKNREGIIKRINCIENRKRQRVRIRARQEKIQYDDKPTKYFYNKEKSRGTELK